MFQKCKHHSKIITTFAKSKTEPAIRIYEYSLSYRETTKVLSTRFFSFFYMGHRWTASERIGAFYVSLFHIHFLHTAITILHQVDASLWGGELCAAEGVVSNGSRN